MQFDLVVIAKKGVNSSLVFDDIEWCNKSVKSPCHNVEYRNREMDCCFVGLASEEFRINTEVLDRLYYAYDNISSKDYVIQVGDSLVLVKLDEKNIIQPEVVS